MSQEVIEITEREIEVIEVVEKGPLGPIGPVGPQANINYTVVTANQTLSNSQNIAADTSGGSFTLTLPASPNAGDSIDIFDYANTFDTNPLTIARNGENIESLAEDLTANIEGAYFTLIYTGATRGWQILPRYGVSGIEDVLSAEGDLLYRGASSETRLPIGTAGQVLKVNSGATAPEWGSISGSISVTGSDLTLSGATGTAITNATIANDAVSNAKLANMVQSTLKGRATASTGDPEDLSASQVRTILNVADGAEVNVNADWDAVSGDAQILNKPTLGTASSRNIDAISDADLRIVGSSDSSKKIAFEVDTNVPTTSTVTLTAPAASGTLALTSDFAAPPAIGNTTPAAISGTTGTFSSSVFCADLKQVNGANAWLGIAIGPSVGPRFAVYNGRSLWRSNEAVGWNNQDSLAVNSTGDLFINRDAANTLAQRNGTAAQTFNIYNTFTSATNHERGFLKWSSNVFQIGTEKGSGGGTARDLELLRDGSMVIKCLNGQFDFTGTIRPTSNNVYSLGLNSRRWTNIFLTTSLLFGDSTSATDPQLKKSSATLQVRLADDSAFAGFSCGALTLNGNLDASTRDIVTDTTTGTKIGTATTQKIGFFNATPVDQPALTADLLDSLQEVGLVASGSGDTPLNLSGGTLTAGNLVLTDSTGSETATFDAQSKLSANRTYDLPDASGTLVVATGAVTVEATSDTLLTFKLKGSDNVVRSVAFAIS